jgi:signal transduction histidine kinase/putative methionine-R-sulfoxide reductase with GAF domain
MTATPDNAAPDPRLIIAELHRKLDEARAELATRNNAYSERIAYQAAANDVLKMMSASPGDPQPVFDLISIRARDLCDAYGVTVCEFDGSLLHWRAATGVSEDPAVREAAKAAFPLPPTRDLAVGRAILDRAIVHIPDYETEQGLRRFSLDVKSSVVVPLMRGGVPIGTLQMGSRERGGFFDTQVELLKTFADQAVIAIENARLFHEVQTKTRDLTEALTYQTGSANILKVIASSPTDVGPVMKAIVESACELCGAYDAVALLKEGEDLLFSPHHGPIPMRSQKRSINRKWTAGRAFIDKKAVHVHDLQAERDEFPEGREMARDMGHRSIVSVPLLCEGESIGALVLRRIEVNPFSEKQIALLQTFADQAVIAIENARLFNETKEALERQTATAEVLRVIASSPSDLQPVFEAIATRSTQLVGGHSAAVSIFVGDMVHLGAFTPVSPEADAAVKALYPRRLADYPLFELARGGEVAQVSDIETDTRVPSAAKATAQARGFRSLMLVPMNSDTGPIGVITVTRKEPGTFAALHIQLLQTFADQAVIAIKNVELFEEVQQRTRELSKSLDELRAAQDRLIQTEKLASLGQLTAGIAHEIKNPLNFVNNFAALSVELTDELKGALKPAALDQTLRADVDEITGLLKDNLGKVVQHGKRADSIVKSMLLHSREGSGERRSAEINRLVEESLSLAYHGARAEKPGFTITLRHDLDLNAGTLDLYPQEITRALLNLISNGFYAATRRKIELSDETFEPLLSAATRDLGEAVEIRIRDNGTGIPPEVKEKMFNPFFTTKPSGEGTGLGLSMTHDIIVKQHAGRIDVETEPGVFTEFIITLPRGNVTVIGEKPE